MNASVTTTVTIDASPEQVFRYVSQPQLHYLWNSSLESISPKSLTVLAQGVGYTSTSLLFGIKVTAKNTVVSFVQDKAMSIENDTGLIHYCVEYTLKSKADKTELTCATTVTPDSKAFAFIKPVIKTLAQRELQSDLEALKLAVEEGLEYTS